MKLSKRLGAFPEYIHSRMAKAATEVEKRSGRKVLNFGAGSPDFRTSDAYLKKFSEFIQDPDSHLYPGYKGIPEFNEAIKGWYKRRFGVELSEDEILPLLGGKDGVSHLPLALADEGDDMLVPDPGYPAFAGPAVMFGINPIPYNLTSANDFKPDVAQLEKLITKKTKYLWLNFPSNPTGQVATLDDLQPIVDFAVSRDLPIIYDHAYAEITFDDFVAPSILQIPEARKVAVELGSFSKVFSFAGFRMGWLVGNRDIVQALAKVKSQVDSGMMLPLQRLGAYALTNTDMEWHDKMLESYENRRDIIAKKLKDLGLTFEIPRGALYIWAKIPDSAEDSESYCMQLLKEKQVLFTPGSAFGKNGDRFVRVSICVNIDGIDNYL